MDDFTWAHTMKDESGKEVAFVHIDTSFLNYHKNGEIEGMK